MLDIKNNSNPKEVYRQKKKDPPPLPPSSQIEVDIVATVFAFWIGAEILNPQSQECESSPGRGSDPYQAVILGGQWPWASHFPSLGDNLLCIRRKLG